MQQGRELLEILPDLRMVITSSPDLRDEILKRGDHWREFRHKNEITSCMSSKSGIKYPFYFLLRTPRDSNELEPLPPTVSAMAVVEELHRSGQIEASQLLEEMLQAREDKEGTGVGVLTGSGSSVAEPTVVKKKRPTLGGKAINFNTSLKKTLYGEWRRKSDGAFQSKSCLLDCCTGQGLDSVLRGGVAVQQIGRLIVFEVQEKFAAFNISDACVAIGGTHFSPVWILLSGNGHQSCIVRVGENSWVHANDSLITAVSVERISELLRRSIKSVVVSVDSSLISSCPRVVEASRTRWGNFATSTVSFNSSAFSSNCIVRGMSAICFRVGEFGGFCGAVLQMPQTSYTWKNSRKGFTASSVNSFSCTSLMKRGTLWIYSTTLSASLQQTTVLFLPGNLRTRRSAVAALYPLRSPQQRTRTVSTFQLHPLINGFRLTLIGNTFLFLLTTLQWSN
jgi:hypothetical protein